MEISSVILLIVYALGAIQGLVFGISLTRSQGVNKQANIILGVILFLFTYHLVVQIMRLFGLGYYDTWYYFMLDLNWVAGPLLYFYVRALLNKNRGIQKADFIHFIPLIAQIICSEYVRLQNLFWDGTRESLSWLGYWGYVVWMNMPFVNLVASLIIVIYSFKAIKLLRSVDDAFEIDPKRTQWIKRIVGSFALYFSLILIVLAIDLSSWSDLPWYFHFERFYYYPYFIGISVLTYWIGLEGFKRKDEEGISVKNEISDRERKLYNQIIKQLHKAMVEDELFKDQELSLNSTAQKLNIKSYLISRSLKEIESTTFRDFVNQFRLSAFKEMISLPENDKYDLLSIAMEVGFNSKSSFNRAVKKHYGISPSELRTVT